MNRPALALSVAWLAVITVTAGRLAAADVASGPAAGVKAPALSVFDATGPHADRTVDYAKLRGEKPTVYVFVKAAEWSRPMARFLRGLDKQAADWGNDAYVVAVWLTDDPAKAKAYLPRAQQSIKLAVTALTVYEADATGPLDWNIDTSAHLTAVVANKGKVAAAFGYISVNATLVPEVFDALKKTK